jgi:hypothetical protein
MDKVKYLPHPCSIEIKKEWNAKGYRVLDERFKPADLVEEEKPKKTRKTKAAK